MSLRVNRGRTRVAKKRGLQNPSCFYWSKLPNFETSSGTYYYGDGGHFEVHQEQGRIQWLDLLPIAQNPIQNLSRAEISSWIDDVYKMFKDHPGCEEWTNKLLDELKNSTGHDAGSIRDILEDFRKNGNISVYQSANRSGVADPRAISISSAVRNAGGASTVMGEIMHSAGMPGGAPKGGYYTDHSQILTLCDYGMLLLLR